jgi:Baseplate J-like protein
MPAPDRRAALLGQNRVTGLDFVYVFPGQTQLDVHFLRAPDTLQTSLVNDLPKERVTIESTAGLPDVGVEQVAWPTVAGERVLRITTTAPGGFSLYRLRIDDTRIDPYSNGLPFSFKAGCDSTLDCKPGPHECPPEDEVDYPVDYLARDFWSFRRALLDFASDRYPDWQERLEADAGVMLVEAMSAVGDELAYYQDRIAREAHLESATQRRSVRRHARLVDYSLSDGAGATTWLKLTAAPNQAGTIAAGHRVATVAETEPSVTFEVGRGLGDIGTSFAFDAELNALEPHGWDEGDTCLAAGTTELHVDGHHAAKLPQDKWVLLETDPADPAVEPRAWPVRLVSATNTKDPVIGTSGTNITRLVWPESQATPFELELDSLQVSGNLVPATEGRTETARFTAGVLASRGAGDDPAQRPSTVERAAPDGDVTHLFGLAGTEDPDLVWRAGVPSLPEVRVWELDWTTMGWSRLSEWRFERSLLDAPRAARRFTLDDGQWRRVAGFRTVSGEVVHRDYATGRGETVRFGAGEFGLAPAQGTVFEVEYRIGGGRRGNVPAGSLTNLAQPLPAGLAAVTNPLAVTDGADAESLDDVRRLAPDAFRALTFRAVRPEDYAEAAGRLTWVQRAGARFRWTGSWLTAFVTPDPRGQVTLEEGRRIELEEQLDRFRQAGRETTVLAPSFADLDLEITVCVEPSSYRGDVEARVLEALVGRDGVPGGGYFDPDNFTFGTDLLRSDLEAAIQRVPGVRAVEGMRIRRRGWFDWRTFAELRFEIAPNEVLRLEQDRTRPERGSLKLVMKGGA